MIDALSRREMLTHAGLWATAGCAAAAPNRAAASDTPTATASNAPALRYCLNTSTVREQKLSLAEEVDLAADAGYQGIEPWIREIQRHAESGGTLSALRRHIEDRGLRVESAIGFANWIVDDDTERAKGLEQLKRDMELVSQIGGTRIAAPPVGATQQSDLNLFRAAQRYRQALEVGEQTGVTPQLELWGFSQSLSRLGELMFVAVESGHARACVLLDVYHIFKGGSDFTGLHMVSGHAMHVLHMNDYPAGIGREKITDADRVYPGDGIAPLAEILRTICQNGFNGVLSLELFNPQYWKQDAGVVARTGLQKMQAAVNLAFS